MRRFLGMFGLAQRFDADHAPTAGQSAPVHPIGRNRVSLLQFSQKNKLGMPSSILAPGSEFLATPSEWV